MRTIADTARALAVEHHRDQRYGNGPFTHHLTTVAGLVALHSTDQTTVAAAWLHDIVEDTEIEASDLRAAYGEEVAEIVELLSFPEGMTRFQQLETQLPKIAAHPKAALIKLADRYANHAFTLLTRDQKFAARYLAEFDFFMATFYKAGRDRMPLFHMIGAQQEPLRRLAELHPVRAMSSVS